MDFTMNLLKVFLLKSTWMLEGEALPTRKLRPFLHQREKISKVIEETGRSPI